MPRAAQLDFQGSKSSARRGARKGRTTRTWQVEQLEGRRLLSGDYGFARKFGSAGYDGGRAIAADAAGNVYVTGYFTGKADFDPGPGTLNLTSAGDNDAFVLKLNSSGNLAWAQRLGSSGNDVGLGIAVDGSGNVYVTGRFQGTADFDPGPNTLNLASAGSDDAFVVKLNSGGGLAWAGRLGGSGSDVGHDIAVDGSGNAYLTGSFRGTADFDPGTGTLNLASAGDNDAFVVKLGGGGNSLWARRVGGTGQDTGVGIAVDGSGSVFIGGTFQNTVDFDPGTGTRKLTSLGEDDGFLMKLDGAGNFAWAAQVGSWHVDEHLMGVAVDATGNVYATGHFEGAVDFDPGPGTFNLASNGTAKDVFVWKLNGAGNLAWARNMGGDKGDFAYSIAVDGSGGVYTTGHYYGAADFDPGPGTRILTSAGQSDVFVSKLIDVAANNRELFINFDGASISRADLVRFAGSDWSGMVNYFDADANGVGISAFLAGRPDRETVISQILANVQNDLNPFGITVRRTTGLAVENRGVTTIFAGRSTLSNGLVHVACDIDYFNNNKTDIAFVGDEDWGSAADTALAMSDVFLHEAGHTFGLYHVNTLQGGVLYNESMGLRYSTSDRGRWLADTSFMDRSFNEYLDHGGGRGPQNSYRTMLQNFPGGGSAPVFRGQEPRVTPGPWLWSCFGEQPELRGQQARDGQGDHLACGCPACSAAVAIDRLVAEKDPADDLMVEVGSVDSGRVPAFGLLGAHAERPSPISLVPNMAADGPDASLVATEIIHRRPKQGPRVRLLT